MKELVPFFQSLVWPVFIGIVLMKAKDQVKAIFGAIRLRIECGDTFEAGASGVKLKLTSSVRRQDSKEKSMVFHNKDDVTPAEKLGIYLAHKARRDRSMDRNDQEYYRLKIFLETDPDVSLNCVTKVIYHLHSSFSDPDRTVTDQESQFELVTYGWGQFCLTADVFLKDQSEPLVLERYLNF